jgi:formylglycine-generating enzyme
MRFINFGLWLSGLGLLFAGLPKCASPTALTVTVYSEIPCDKRPVAGVAVGKSAADIVGKPFSTTSLECGADGKMGSVVLYPSGSSGSQVAIQVVARPDGEDPSRCTDKDNYKGCIVARRQLQYAPNQNLQMRIDLRLSCLDVPCDVETTCARGTCLTAQAPCASSCDEAAIPGFVQAKERDAGAAAADADAGLLFDASPVDATVDSPRIDSLRSCKGLELSCGPKQNESCCTALPVSGGTFFRATGVPTVDMTYPATVASFYLDRFEATIGRFDSFLVGYPGNMPAVGSGKNPNDPNDSGWTQALADTLLGIYPTAAEARTKIQAARVAFDLAPVGEKNEPVVAVPWAAAVAFCIWDGGRLPSEAEWNYAASGGDQHRVYPWSVPPTDATVDNTVANIKFASSGVGKPVVVGSFSPKGDARWGHADMGGNAWEWTIGPSNGLDLQVPCNNCTQYPGGSASQRGGSSREDASFALNSHRDSSSSLANASFGFRCARAGQ